MDFKYYILDKDKNPVEAKNVHEFGMFFECMENRRVGYHMHENGVTISTVFLGINHGFPPNKSLILFETMVFGINGEELYMERYATWDEAKKRHGEIVESYDWQ